MEDTETPGWLAHRDRERLARLDRRRSARADQGLPPETPEEAEAAVAAIMAPAPAAALPGRATQQAIDELERFVRAEGERTQSALAAGDAAGAEASLAVVRAGSALLVNLRAALSGAEDAGVLLKRQPTAAQLAMPGRRPVLVERARRAVSRTKWAFMSPENVLGSLAALLGGPTPDALEAELRILHYLAYGNLSADGLQAAAFVARLVAAGKAALRLAAGEGRPGDGEAAERTRAIVLGFLERARA